MLYYACVTYMNEINFVNIKKYSELGGNWSVYEQVQVLELNYM